MFLAYVCSRVPAHRLCIALQMSSPSLLPSVAHHNRWLWVSKIGQYPSLADMQRDLSPRAAKALGKKGATEFKRGVGLAAHGIGIGSFVYLRRIFEDLVDEVAGPAISAGVIAGDEYQKSRMDERIGLLKSVPAAVHGGASTVVPASSARVSTS